MKVKKIYYSSHFARSCQKLSLKERKIFKEKLKLFRQDPFVSVLKTHKLSGKLKNFWSFSATDRLRVMFEFIKGKGVGLIDIGTHDIYR